MSEQDRRRWDDRYRAADPAPPGPPSAFVEVLDRLPVAGRALDLACGGGSTSVWLARRGLVVLGVDVSPLAIDRLGWLARINGADDCRGVTWDLDDGLPPDADGPFDVVLCHLFSDPRLDGDVVERLAPGGMLAIAVLSEVGARPGRFRAAPGELGARFGRLPVEVVWEREGAGVAALLARAADDPGTGGCATSE